MAGSTSDIKFEFEPWDGTPGDAYDKWEVRLLNYASKSDDRGWSLADHLLGNDEGGPNGPNIRAAKLDRERSRPTEGEGRRATAS